MKIQKPTLGRIVLFTASDGHQSPAVVADVTFAARGIVGLRTLGPDTHYEASVPYDADDRALGTWRYPPMSKEEIELPDPPEPRPSPRRVPEPD
jgi:hypothetical protein